MAMSKTHEAPDVRFSDINCTITVSRPHQAVVLVTFEGRDTGVHGDGPFAEIAKGMSPAQPIELFIDARSGRSASLDVSSDWARWLARNRSCFVTSACSRARASCSSAPTSCGSLRIWVT
jgi:hypothetical protein